MARAGDHLVDAAALAQLRERALAAPRHVLGAVVGQDLLGSAVVGDGSLEDLAHQRSRRARVQPVADDVAAVVVHEGDHVHAAALALEHEGEQVRLPQMVGLGALEALDPWWVWARRHLLVALFATAGVAGLVYAAATLG
jgi:hypothetical protein